jgi:hypothetical protein
VLHSIPPVRPAKSQNFRPAVTGFEISSIRAAKKFEFARTHPQHLRSFWKLDFAFRNPSSAFE